MTINQFLFFTPGDNQHLEMRSDLSLDLKADAPPPAESMAYVGLLTPPRTLTMDETFPVVDEPEEMRLAKQQAARHASPARQMIVSGNGHM